MVEDPSVHGSSDPPLSLGYWVLCSDMHNLGLDYFNFHVRLLP